MEYMSISQAAEKWGISPRRYPGTLQPSAHPRRVSDGLCLGHPGRCGETEGCES